MGGNQSSAEATVAREPVTVYAKIFDYMHEGCQIISRDYTYLYVNDIAARQGHSTAGKLMGRTMLDCYPGIEHTEMFSRLRDCLEKKTAQSLDSQVRFADGAIGWFELRMEPVPEGAIILSIDITRRKKAEEHVRQLEEVKTTFMQIVARQLRTPMATMHGNLEKLRGTANDTFGMEERVQLLTAHNAAMEVMRRIGDMINAIHVNDEAGPAKKPIKFDDLWVPIYADCKQRSEAEQVRLIYAEPAAPYPIVRGDPERLRLVLASVVDNALRYTKAGKITISVEPQQNYLRFQISDTGIGVPADEQSRIFNTYFRGSNAVQLNPGGTGLSLAVAKYYVEQHGGKIGFISEQNKGSTFWFELPVR